MKTVNRISLVLLIAASFSQAAYARRADREGLNFGSSVRIMDSDDRGQQSTLSDKNTRTKSAGQAFSPYLGYSFEALNLGIMLNVENKYEEFSEKSPSTNQELSRQASTSSKAASLFARFNFGKIMYFQAGAGVYSQVTDIRTELRNTSGLEFQGTTSNYKLEGMGPGYHAGVGLELPASNGFFFTGSYMVHNYQLRDTTHSSYGSLIGSQQKRELAFGIAYYN